MQVNGKTREDDCGAGCRSGVVVAARLQDLAVRGFTDGEEVPKVVRCRIDC